MTAAPRLLVVGAGLVGRRASSDLAARGGDVTLVSHSAGKWMSDPTLVGVRCQVGRVTSREFDGVVLATDSRDQAIRAATWLRRGVGVVSTADRPSSVRAMMRLTSLSRSTSAPLAVGVGCAPGLSTLLALRLAQGLERVDVLTTARFGTGGPTCAREHHRSMAGRSQEIREGSPRWVRAGSGRALVWFPEPVGPQDCYRAGLVEPFLLHQVAPEVARIQALQAATRRDRLTARLPMLRPPHAEGRVGAVWAEARGVTSGGEFEHRVLAATAPQATIAAAVAAAVTWHQVAVGSPADRVAGGPLWWCDDPAAVLRDLPDSVRLWGPDGAHLERPTSSDSVRAARKWASTPTSGGFRRLNIRLPFRGDLPKVKRPPTDYSF